MKSTQKKFKHCSNPLYSLSSATEVKVNNFKISEVENFNLTHHILEQYFGFPNTAGSDVPRTNYFFNAPLYRMAISKFV